MSGNKQRGIIWNLWTLVAVAITALASVTAGYYIGASRHTENGTQPSYSIDWDESGNITKLTVTDDYGRAVALNGVPKRIVSVSPTPTEILFAVGAGDLVVGVDEYSDYPAEATNRTKVGSFTLNIEAIVGLDPDLIVSSDLVPQQQLDQLMELGYPYFIFATRDFEGVFKDIRMAGVLTWHIAEADALATSLEARVDAVALKTLAAGVTKPRTYVEYYPYYTYGPGSFGDDLIRLAGGMNVGHNLTSEYPTATSEFVVASDPQIIVYAVGPLSTTNATEIASRPGWDTISAVKDMQIYSVDENILSRYGPRIVDCLEQLAEIIHPELFG